jgi:hypothetical protein
MIDKLSPDQVLFLDIETVPQHRQFDELEHVVQDLWCRKTQYMADRKGIGPDALYETAGIYAEFGKVICIGAGYFKKLDDGYVFRVTTWHGDDEQLVLDQFSHWLQRFYKKPFQALCAHNGKEFDFPYLCRRMLANRVSIPDALHLAGKKPWEIPHIDTMDMWKFGDYKHYTSVPLLAHTLGIPSPKDDMDGSEVSKVYYDEHNLERIAQYCMKDVITIGRIFMRFCEKPWPGDEEIQIFHPLRST